MAALQAAIYVINNKYYKRKRRQQYVRKRIRNGPKTL